MDAVSVGSIVGRRLDRLRSSRPIAARTHAASGGHADELAAGLDGQVVGGQGGRVVAIHSNFHVPMVVERLAALPYSVDTAAPLVFVDLETTGLATAAGTLAFLVGVGIWSDGSLRLEQLLLPDHAGEQALLDRLSAVVPADAWLVTYNGKSFDWPLVTARYRMHRRAPPLHAGHLDLLHIARQLWKHRLGGARLALVEQEICGVVRTDDLPGELIPERYFSYLRTRSPELLRTVVEHNRQDIVSMARLLAVLARDLADETDWPRAHPGDLYGLARGYARRRRTQEALSVVEAALRADAWSRGVEGGAQLHRRLSADRARLLASLGRRREAYEAWLTIGARGGPGAATAWLHVARYREHELRDVGAAMDACREAYAVAERARAWGAPLVAVEGDLARRVPRLRRLSFRRRPISARDAPRAA